VLSNWDASTRSCFPLGVRCAPSAPRVRHSHAAIALDSESAQKRHAAVRKAVEEATEGGGGPEWAQRLRTRQLDDGLARCCHCSNGGSVIPRRDDAVTFLVSTRNDSRKRGRAADAQRAQGA
jgi:hypothetical protein